MAAAEGPRRCGPKPLWCGRRSDIHSTETMPFQINEIVGRIFILKRMSGDPLPTTFSNSVWRKPQTATAFQSLVAGGERVDVIVIGGGILGLSTALHAARLGLTVQVLDGGEIGQGASGLNGGQVIPGLKYDPEWLLQHFGPERGEALVNFAASTANAVFELIRDEKLAVPSFAMAGSRPRIPSLH
ncbi:FAD-binding oxidoreductase [Mesorhizobium sp. INR15]|uniref:NAD(P)/FAD-dependent oxidoreductase n=1 Tax=Mesorhizobium sp. INR15 TaxID=2654248 RepID=UPI0027E41DF7|nr:FAD-binding oxidoreductase [Mesorhizobium sp. INR15]